MTDYYLDSSVALRIILGHSTEAGAWFDGVIADEADRVISSRLLRTEITRVLRRENLPVANRDKILEYVYTVPVDHAVLHEAESIISHIHTLDAIHLASALRCGLDELIIVTHDKDMSEVAERLGFPVHDPVH
ncbi:type II toxin-antitoxin system VapC family toxin [Nocardia aurantia]|uniref:PIN domain-containing protein n=1 Tax=Nocardia aurantia TaxID=2585199 RepID=A0A7K0DS18_9NOCA|nr:type II toxin-antitoxin system VapC family toxin [Nocardia aurantia]MQY28398.1 hypothetical protein [Nocardia aurantia]